MKAVIIAAGAGTRFGKVTENLPKPLLIDDVYEHHSDLVIDVVENVLKNKKILGIYCSS